MVGANHIQEEELVEKVEEVTIEKIDAVILEIFERVCSELVEGLPPAVTPAGLDDNSV